MDMGEGNSTQKFLYMKHTNNMSTLLTVIKLWQGVSLFGKWETGSLLVLNSFYSCSKGNLQRASCCATMPLALLQIEVAVLDLCLS
jgi:hypothetical protein